MIAIGVRTGAMALVTLAVTGCMLARQSTPVTILAPQVQVSPAADWPTVQWSLSIERPRSDALRDSTRVLVHVPPSEMRVYPRVSWLEPVPDLLQSVLLQAFEDSGRITAVGRAGTQRSRYRLHLELRRFEAVEQATGLEADVEVHAKLILNRNGQIVAAARFRRTAAAGDQAPDLVNAFQATLAGLAREVVGWTLATGEADARPNAEPDPGSVPADDHDPSAATR